MKTYRVRARYASHLTADWREKLASRLGGRPRRLGEWTELGLYGALECLAELGTNVLEGDAALVLSSRHGPTGAMREAMKQAREGLPLPLTFLQTQPSQLLAALSAQLGWCGDARFIAHPNPLSVLALALVIADSHANGLLVGWVNELEIKSSLWLRLDSLTDPGTNPFDNGPIRLANDFTTLAQEASHVRLGPSGVEVIIGPQAVSAK